MSAREWCLLFLSVMENTFLGIVSVSTIRHVRHCISKHELCCLIEGSYIIITITIPITCITVIAYFLWTKCLYNIVMSKFCYYFWLSILEDFYVRGRFFYQRILSQGVRSHKKEDFYRKKFVMIFIKLQSALQI